jgi:hypothetical protein
MMMLMQLLQCSNSLARLAFDSHWEGVCCREFTFDGPVAKRLLRDHLRVERDGGGGTGGLIYACTQLAQRRLTRAQVNYIVKQPSVAHRTEDEEVAVDAGESPAGWKRRAACEGSQRRTRRGRKARSTGKVMHARVRQHLSQVSEPRIALVEDSVWFGPVFSQLCVRVRVATLVEPQSMASNPTRDRCACGVRCVPNRQPPLTRSPDRSYLEIRNICFRRYAAEAGACRAVPLDVCWPSCLVSAAPRVVL